MERKGFHSTTLTQKFKKEEAAAKRILALSEELQLTWDELEGAIEAAKRMAYISTSPRVSSKYSY